MCTANTGSSTTESDGAIGAQEDVASFEVSVDATFGVQALKTLQHLVSDAADLGLRQAMVQLWCVCVGEWCACMCVCVCVCVCMCVNK